MMFSDSSESACSVSIFSVSPIVRDFRLDSHSDLSRVLSHLVVADGNGLAGAQPRSELELVAHTFGRAVDQQMALVVVAHLEDFRRGLLALHVALAQLQIDNDLHMSNLLAPLNSADDGII